VAFAPPEANSSDQDPLDPRAIRSTGLLSRTPPGGSLAEMACTRLASPSRGVTNSP
jgi:hypothetical protein